MSQEIIYLEHDNTIDLILKSDGIAQNLSNITKITASFNDILIESINPTTGPIKWAQEGYATGEIRLDLGDQDIAAGTYLDVYITIYDSINQNGIVWGSIQIKVLEDIEPDN